MFCLLQSRPGMTFAVDWALNNNYLSCFKTFFFWLTSRLNDAHPLRLLSPCYKMNYRSRNSRFVNIHRVPNNDLEAISTSRVLGVGTPAFLAKESRLSIVHKLHVIPQQLDDS